MLAQASPHSYPSSSRTATHSLRLGSPAYQAAHQRNQHAGHAVMAPFTNPKVVLSGLKDKFHSLTVQADRLYLGSATGALHIYGLGPESLELVEIKKNIARRPIEQLGFLKDVNSLVVLSETTVSLFPLPTLSPPTPLLKANAAFSFAIHTSSVQQAGAQGEFSRQDPKTSLITYLLVGCRRRAVLYSWKDGEPQEVKEAPLPHSARAIVFINKDTACFAYSPTEFAMFSIPTMTAADIVIPLPTTGSSTTMNAISGLTGYMTLGLGAKAKPAVAQTAESELLLAKDGQGFFVGADGKVCRSEAIDWPAQPEEIAFVKPYIFSVLPPGTVPTTTPDASVTPAFNATSVIQIRSSLSLEIQQTLPFPFNAPGPTTVSQNASLRLLTASSAAKSPLYLLSTPTDKTAAASDGTSLWCFSMHPWSAQIDELVLAGKYADALVLLGTLDDAQVPDKDQRRIRIRALNAVAQFRDQKWDAAIQTFVDLDFNPAKVVALYPEAVAGRLSVPQEAWIQLYGGPAPLTEGDAGPEEGTSDGHTEEKPGSPEAQTGHERTTTGDVLDNIVSATGSVSGRLRKAGLGGLGKFMHTGPKDDDTASITAKKKVVQSELNQSIESLIPYLSDRRFKLRAALETINITPENQSHHASPLSEASLDELFGLPNAPLSLLTPEQLLRFAQIVDTVLYKSYLIIRPALLGSLCRVANWCEVSEVEEDLRARKKYAELRDLYNGKKMHSKALDLLKELGTLEEDMEDKLSPSIQYLQKLGPEYIDEVFRYARWIFDTDKDMAFQIFTSDDVELPKKAVADYLESISPSLCARYLEYMIAERQEESAQFHDRLADLYLSMTVAAKKRGDQTARNEIYAKLLEYISTDDKFGIDRFYGYISGTDLHEARAIILGRLGKHSQALETYVYRLQDFAKAEEYCKRIYKPGTDTAGIYLNLLRIYLRPTTQVSVDLLEPALTLISRHGPRLDSVETLQLLPPLVTTEEIKAFLVDALRVPLFDTKVVRNISKSRDDQLARRLMSLQSKMVKVTDSRICPQCHKRLGNSVIAVHAPRGEVTHYQCRELFARRLRSS
ncbi:hypothetical protein D9619_004692 [Psilocybe cf. subviscida]|uniref:CNH domain-containing protein n=1 Tax=Psilocybe cf. subviscida TaxID=2480587 RepID=A0A8H5BQX8_9AGAR|nr:hypothetical protein D9619_004692 [Psilocybe cf. subviscida]